MDNVFDLYVAGKGQPVRSVTLPLPASIYEMVDAVERVGLEKVEELCFEVEESHRGEYLVDALEEDITLPELNILAWKVAEMDEGQEAILEGLIKMEQKKQDVPWLPYPKLLQLAENTACCHRVPQARNDSQLGRFYAENGFVEGVDDLPDRLFELLDFEKIGREARLAEGGVFTEDSGYVVRHQELKELEKLPDLIIRRPYYTMLLEISLAEYENGPVFQLELPTTQEHIKALAEKFPLDEHIVRCTDCAIPFFRGCIEEKEMTLWDLNEFAQMMDFALERGEIAKYKALVLATGCRDAAQAAELGRQQSMAEYWFQPNQGENGPTAYASSWLKKKLGKDAALIPDQGLERLGRRLIERENIADTEYGLIQRTDDQPIHCFDLEPEQGCTMSM